jgi:hypothetical protein
MTIQCCKGGILKTGINNGMMEDWNDGKQGS